MASISITSPASGSAGTPTVVNPTFTVNGAYDGTPASDETSDTVGMIPTGATLKRFVQVELMTPISGNSFASEFSDAGDQNASGTYSISVALSAGDARRTNLLKLTPILRVTSLLDVTGAVVTNVKTNA